METVGKFPGNSHGLLRLAKAQMELEDLVDAHYSFNKARVNDALNVDYMDHCAVLAKRRGQTSDLNRLAHDLVSTNRKRPEAWIAVALYAEHRGEKEKALAFVEKAIALRINRMFTEVEALAATVQLAAIKDQEVALTMRDECKRHADALARYRSCLLYTSPSPRDATLSRMPSSA